jgi:hypothetical protein
MSGFSKRLAKLESGRVTSPGDLVVIIRQFGPGEYDRAKCPTGQIIYRRDAEDETAFLKRACVEGVAATKAKMGRQSTYTIQPLREEISAETTA